MMDSTSEENEVSAVERDEQGAKEATINRKRNSPRKILGSLKDNIVGAIRGDVKQIFFMKAKLIVFAVIAIFVVAALIVEGIAEDTAATARSKVTGYYANDDSEAGQLYNATGSLVLATDEDIAAISNRYIQELGKTNSYYQEVFSTLYSGKERNTVANKVVNITLNFEANQTDELVEITDEFQTLEGAALPSDTRTIFEHILNTERYNFNSIIWRSFEKQGDSLEQTEMEFELDEDTRLIYPENDPEATNAEDLDIDFFLTKVRPYLMTWQIPFNLMVGTQDLQDSENLNADFAYEIIASAYHEIVLDRYKIESLHRRTNYLVYDRIITTTTTTRSCGLYEVTEEITKRSGDTCSRIDYQNGLCKDAVRSVRVECTDEAQGCLEDEKGKYIIVNCDDQGYPDCTYGVIKDNTTVTRPVTRNRNMCTDTTSITTNEQRDIRETKSEITEGLTYAWNYVVSSAKMLDKVLSYTYKFTPYYEYPTNNYYNFINKSGRYAGMSVQEYRESEMEQSQAMDFTIEEEDYKSRSEEVDTTNEEWNETRVVDAIPENAKLVGSITTETVNKVVETVIDGKEYTDRYTWSDTLDFESMKNGIYNIDSVKDVTDNDLTEDDYDYYATIYAKQELNLIDLMNSDNLIYKNYVEEEHMSPTTTNIGIRKSALDISYNVLKKELQTLSNSYPITGLMYGSSFGLLQGLNLSSVVASNSVNDAIVYAAQAHLGYNLDDMMTLETYGTFFRNHWCAMFVSYCLRIVEHQADVTIPIPNFTGCTTFWNTYHNKPGFYDVQEWLTANPNASLKNTDPTHIASLAAIQPGDIILYCWDATEGRHHTAIVKSVEKEAGNVTAITTIDGNWNGTNYNNSTVQEVRHSITGDSPYNSLSSVASFISVSTVIAEAENGNTW